MRASPRSSDSTRAYAWFSALTSEDAALLDDLLAHGVPVDVLHPLRHSTALMEATRLGRATLVRWLIERGAAPVFASGSPQGTPIHCALHLHHFDIAWLLVDAAEEITPTDAYGCTALHALVKSAIATDATPEIRALCIALIHKGCPIDARDRDGTTALHYCVIHDMPEFAELLLKQGANPNATVPETEVSPLSIAAMEKNLPMAELLMRYGADPYLKSTRGRTPAEVHPGIIRLMDDGYLSAARA